MENQPKVTVEKRFHLKVWDFLEGIYDAVFLPILVTILEVIQTGSFALDWESLGKIAIAGVANYLLKAFLKPTKVVIEQPKPETPQIVSAALARANQSLNVRGKTL